jgi:very-short-patch-repair endonuclease
MLGTTVTDFHLKHFTDVAEIDGEQLAPEREDTHTQRDLQSTCRQETSMGWRVP